MMLTKKMNNKTILPKKKNKKQRKIINTTLIYIGLIIASLAVILPFLIIFITSFKTVADASSYDFTIIGQQDGISFQGYIKAFEYTDFNTGLPILLVGFFNTMLTSVVPTVSSLFLSALAAFAFAKINFKFSKIFFDILM